MAKKLHKLLTLVLVSAFLLTGFGEQVHAIVLCFGDDGHSAIEREKDGHCSEWFSEAKAGDRWMPSENALFQGENSDPCFDFCLSWAGESVRKNQTSGLTVPSLPTTYFQSFRAEALLTPNLSLADIPPPSQAAVALRSTVLLI